MDSVQKVCPDFHIEKPSTVALCLGLPKIFFSYQLMSSIWLPLVLMPGHRPTILRILQVLNISTIIFSRRGFLWAACHTLPNSWGCRWELLPLAIAKGKEKLVLGQFFHFSNYLGDKSKSILMYMCPIEEGMNPRIFSADVILSMTIWYTSCG